MAEERHRPGHRRRVRFSPDGGGVAGERAPLTTIPESAYEGSDYNDLLAFRGGKYLARTWAPRRDNAVFWY